MKNRKRCALYMLLSLAVVFQTVGCSLKEMGKDTKAADEVKTVIEPMETEEVITYGFDYLGGKDVMPIMGYYGPVFTNASWNGNDMPEYVSDEFFELIKGTGINIIGKCDVTWGHQKYVEMLQLCEKYGLGLLVNDSRLYDSASKDMSLEEADNYVKDYADYTAYVGNYIVDEPQYKGYFYSEGSTHTIENFANGFQKLNELGIFAYGNLFPSQMGSKDAYLNYLAAYLESSPVRVLCYDMYPFEKESDNITTYFENLAIIRNAAEKTKIPFWTFIQAGGQWNDATNYFDSVEYYPTQGEFYWLVGTSLAYGAKGINYFPLIQPIWFAYSQTEPWDFQRNGLIGAYGNKTRWYYYAQDMNAQIAAVDEVLMNSVNKGIIITGEQAKADFGSNQFLMEGDSWRELAGVQGDTLIGCFNYNGKSALYVVNYDYAYAQNITLDFVDNFKMKVIQDAKTSYVAGDSLELTLSAGNSALVVFE